MAGKPGMKGGGGRRTGAGRKAGSKSKSKSASVPQTATDMLKMLQDVALGKTEATSLQVRAAIAAVQYTHAKKGEGGKKEEVEGRAQKAASKFGTGQPPPKLTSVK